MMILTLHCRGDLMHLPHRRRAAFTAAHLPRARRLRCAHVQRALPDLGAGGSRNGLDPQNRTHAALSRLAQPRRGLGEARRSAGAGSPFRPNPGLAGADHRGLEGPQARPRGRRWPQAFPGLISGSRRHPRDRRILSACTIGVKVDVTRDSDALIPFIGRASARHYGESLISSSHARNSLLTPQVARDESRMYQGMGEKMPSSVHFPTVRLVRDEWRELHGFTIHGGGKKCSKNGEKEWTDKRSCAIIEWQRKPPHTKRI